MSVIRRGRVEDGEGTRGTFFFFFLCSKIFAFIQCYIGLDYVSTILIVLSGRNERDYWVSYLKEFVHLG